MDKLVDAGFVILGGPLGDGTWILLVVEAADQPEIEMRLGEDPWAPDRDTAWCLPQTGSVAYCSRFIITSSL